MDAWFDPNDDGMPPPSDAYQAAHPNWNARPRGIRHGNLTVFSVADLDTATPRGYLLKGIMSPGELSLWVGPPKCGKSFLMLHIAYLLSLGRPVFGRRVKRTRVLYVAAEGEAGIARRIEALRRKHGDSRHFHFIAQPTDLLHDPGHNDDLKAAARACDAQLIVLDTVNRVLAGGDENSSVDMGALVLYMAELRIETKAHVAAVHHGSKASNGSTPRGHSCLTGAARVLLVMFTSSTISVVMAGRTGQAGHETGRDTPKGVCPVCPVSLRCRPSRLSRYVPSCPAAVSRFVLEV